MTMKILLPVDGSDCALRAVGHLVAHTAWFREVPEIHLLHVQPPIPIGRALAHVSKETLHSHYMEESREHLLGAQQRLDAASRFHTTHIHVGQAAEVIARLANELSCDLIVMGTHGRSGIAGLVMGSVASRVLHLAACPVMLVK
ncbi:MAG: universal stress protein [Azonexus sp.]|jgi:nucleotide-binding universal stress UspA family protein